MDIKVYNLNEIQRLNESNKLNDKMLTLKLWQNKKYVFQRWRRWAGTLLIDDYV